MYHNGNMFPDMFPRDCLEWCNAPDSHVLGVCAIQVGLFVRGPACFSATHAPIDFFDDIFCATRGDCIIAL